jgi:hypothetical protein
MQKFQLKLLSAVSLSLLLGAQPTWAQSGQIELLTWLGGADAVVLDDRVAGFEARYRELTINLVPAY